jgi:hypothetical protein
MITMSFTEFERLVDEHDLTYQYSDDGHVFRRGSASEAKIRAAAEQFDPAEVKRVWDAMVDRTLAEGYRETFYWKG